MGRIAGESISEHRSVSDPELRKRMVALSEDAEAKASESRARAEQKRLQGQFKAIMIALGATVTLLFSCFTFGGQEDDDEPFYGYSRGTVKNMALLILLSILGFAALWQAGLVQPILGQMIVYVYLAVICIAILSIMASESLRRIDRVFRRAKQPLSLSALKPAARDTERQEPESTGDLPRVSMPRPPSRAAVGFQRARTLFGGGLGGSRGSKG